MQLTGQSGSPGQSLPPWAKRLKKADRMRYCFVLIAGVLMLAPAVFGQSAPQTLLPPGDLSTKGNQIVDRNGRPVRLACVGWNQVVEEIALEGQTALMAKLGFNCIRHSWVNATKDRDIAEIDRVAVAAGKAGLRVI